MRQLAFLDGARDEPLRAALMPLMKGIKEELAEAAPALPHGQQREVAYLLRPIADQSLGSPDGSWLASPVVPEAVL